MSPPWLEELVLHDINERNLYGADEVILRESVSIPNLEHYVLCLVWDSRSYLQGLVPLRI